MSSAGPMLRMKKDNGCSKRGGGAPWQGAANGGWHLGSSARLLCRLRLLLP